MRVEEIMHAAEMGDAESVKTYIRRGRNVNVCDEEGRTPLMLAAESSAECVAALLAAGADAEAGDKDYTTALMFACDANQEDGVRLLVEAAPHVIDARDAFGWTALICAANQGNRGTTRTLLDAGADTKYTESYGRTAAELADENGHRELADMLRLWSAGQKAGHHIYHRCTPLPKRGGYIGTGSLLVADCINLPATLRRNLRYIMTQAPTMLEYLASRSIESGECSVYKLCQEMAQQDPLHVQSVELYLYWMRQILHALAFILPRDSPWSARYPIAHGYTILYSDSSLDTFSPYELADLNETLLHRAMFVAFHAELGHDAVERGGVGMELGSWIS